MQLVDELPDLVEVELGRGVRVHHGGVVDVLAVLRHQRRDGQLLHVDVGADQRGELRRQRADVGRLDAGASTRHGTSTAQSAGSDVMQPLFRTLP